MNIYATYLTTSKSSSFVLSTVKEPVSSEIRVYPTLTLDLRAGYHNIALDEDSIKKTAFILPFGKYECLKVPFGLAQAPAYLKKMMRKVLNGLSFAMAYLDDIFILSETPEQHLAHIKVSMKKLQAVGIRMKRNKGLFFKKELHYLGHLLTTEGIKPQVEK